MASISHHYNPQVYLRQFARRKEFWEYDLTKGTVKSSTPKHAGCEDFYHSFIGNGGQRDDDTLEKSFSFIENRLPELFQAIRNHKPICGGLADTFFWFAAIQRSRSPKMLASLQIGLKKLYEATWALMKDTPDFERWMSARGLEPDEVRDSEFDIQPSRGNSLVTLLSLSERLVECFAKMRWSFLCAPKGSCFFTSDDPVCCWAAPDQRVLLGGVGPETPEVEITFPLSRTVCAYGSWTCSLASYSELPKQHTGGINMRTIINGRRYIYGPTTDPVVLAIIQDSAKCRRARSDRAWLPAC